VLCPHLENPTTRVGCRRKTIGNRYLYSTRRKKKGKKVVRRVVIKKSPHKE
jgi:hypothetical protein